MTGYVNHLLGSVRSAGFLAMGRTTPQPNDTAASPMSVRLAPGLVDQGQSGEARWQDDAASNVAGPRQGGGLLPPVRQTIWVLLLLCVLVPAFVVRIGMHSGRNLSGCHALAGATIHQAGPNAPVAQMQAGTPLVLELRLARSKARKPSAEGIEYGVSASHVEFFCEAKPLSEILTTALVQLGARRNFIVVDPSVPAGLYDVAFRHEVGPNARPDLGILVDAICGATGVRRQQVTESREVWVAKWDGKTDLPAPTGTPSSYTDAQGMHVCRNTPLAVVLDAIASSRNITVIDETGLTASYDVLFEARGELDALWNQMRQEYGLSFTKATRLVSLVRLRAQQDEQ